MSDNFWHSLPKPFFALAPMADVTDAAFRQLIAAEGTPDVFWTEFVSTDGLMSRGREKLLPDLRFSSGEHPIVAQLFGANPDTMRGAAALCAELGFDGIDINMGCPDRAVEKQGAGAALMKDIERARALIAAAREGGGGLPVSVKTRLGYNRMQIEDWIEPLLRENLPALTIHARTRKEMSKVPAHWDQIAAIVRLRDTVHAPTLIMGNGDATDLSHARALAQETGADGIMLGRAIFGNPWLFAKDAPVPSVSERLHMAVRHTRLFEEMFSGHKNFSTMKKHYQAYVQGFPGAAELRASLMNATDAEDVARRIQSFLTKTADNSTKVL